MHRAKFVFLLLLTNLAGAASDQLAGDASGAAPAEPSSPGASEKGFWGRDTFTGDWGGLRGSLAQHGLAFKGSYQAEIFGNVGGARQGFISDGLFNLALDLDLSKAIGFWPGATLHANALYAYGQNLSAKYVGDFSTTSNIAAYNSIRLQELWLEQSFGPSLSLRAGLLAADAEFFICDSGAVFLDSTFGAFTLIGSNFPDAPIYPIANPGLRFSMQPTAQTFFRAAIFGMDENSEVARNNRHGTHFHVHESDGAFVIWELGWMRPAVPDEHTLASTYKLGGFFQRGDFRSFNSQANEALGEGRRAGDGTNFVFYAIADQEVFKTADHTVSVFARGGLAPARLSFVDGYAEAGCNFTGLRPGHPHDVAGLAFAYSKVSDDYSRAQHRLGAPFSSGEGVLELTYRAEITPWLSLQPDLQLILNPSGVNHPHDALAAGLRTSLVF